MDPTVHPLLIYYENTVGSKKKEVGRKNKNWGSGAASWSTIMKIERGDVARNVSTGKKFTVEDAILGRGIKAAGRRLYYNKQSQPPPCPPQ